MKLMRVLVALVCFVSAMSKFADERFDLGMMWLFCGIVLLVTNNLSEKNERPK